MKLDNNNHSVFKLTYHLVLVVKYRRKVITDDISQQIKAHGETIGKKYHITFLEFNHDQDHVHLLFSAHPNTEMSKFINAFKSASSRMIKQQFPEIKKHLWKEYFWSKSFCLLTTGGASIDIMKRYIQTQGEGMKRRYTRREKS
jgi:putative transposase